VNFLFSFEYVILGEMDKERKGGSGVVGLSIFYNFIGQLKKPKNNSSFFESFLSPELDITRLSSRLQLVIIS